MDNSSRTSVILIVVALLILVFGYGSNSDGAGYAVLFLGYPVLLIGVIIGVISLFSNKKVQTSKSK